MNKDFRRNVLTTIGQLVKKIHKLKHNESKIIRQSHFNNMLSDVQLLRNDLILILNQNFYLQCKMFEKEKIIHNLEKRYVQLQENSVLNIRMAQMKYQKLKNKLKYGLFQYKDTETKHQIAEESDFSIHGQFSQIYTHKVELFLTPKKIINLRNVRSSLDNRSTLQKDRNKQWLLEQEIIITEKFDAQTRVGEAVKSEQIVKFDENSSEQRSKSNELNRQRNCNKKRRGKSVDQHIDQQTENCKQSQLKKLVQQQFKVSPLKQRYFCTDLQ